METFNDANLTAEQIKMLTLQFMGQHVTGELKELDKNLVNKTNTLKGMELNPAAVLNSIAATPIQQQTPQLQPEPVQAQQPATFIPAPEPVVIVQQPVLQPVVQKDQLEFNFETSPLSARIFSTLERIEKRLTSIESTLFTIESVNAKKKD